ncbi:MAG: PQQ-binding-like beta-propeller repeat protein [Pirellulales bacterium]|nr:PQQ-binding-like beta-propeller repeat protein [Pirellulales bacterium]
MISAEQFIKMLAEKDLLPSGAVRKLLKQVAQSDKPISARRVAKHLVEKGLLTPALAKRLLTHPGEEGADKAAAAPAPPSAEPPEEELGFAPLPGEEKADEDEDEDVLLLDEPAPKPAAPAPAPPAAQAAPTASQRKILPTSPAAEPMGVQPEPPRRDATPADIASVDVVSGEIVAGEVIRGEVVPDPGKPAGKAAAAEEDEDAWKSRPKRMSGLAGLLQAILPRRDRKRKDNEWDSTLLLVGGGLLLLLVIVGGAVAWSLLGQSGDKMLEQANKFYEEQSYTKAVDQYTQYLDKYAAGEKASFARARRGMAKLRQATEASANPVKSLDVAKEVLDEIKSEDAFGEVKPELKGVLPPIAEALAKQARAKTSTELVERAREALALIENPNIIPAQQRNKAQLDDIRASLALTEREIARDGELIKAVAAIEKATAEKKSDEAYAIRKTLLKTYPDLSDNARLAEAILKVSAAQRVMVQMVAEAKPAETAAPARSETPTVALARNALAREARGAQGQVAFALAQGAVYGLDAATGRVLWRRFVGDDADGVSLPRPPVPLGAEPASDALLVDVAAKAIARVEAATGKPRWQFVVGERFTAEPVVDGERILLATSSGRIVLVEAASGNSPGFLRVPQPLRVAPAVDARRGRLYQVADHSNLYVLKNDGTCETVVYLAHEPGSVTTPPAVLSDFLVVAENRGLDRSLLRIFTLDEKEKTPAFKELQRINLEGRVDARPLVDAARLLVTTDQGRVVAFRLSGADAQQPLEQIAQQQTSDRRDVVRFPLLAQDQFWIADDHLTKYVLQASMGKFHGAWTACTNSAFRQPILNLGQTLFVARQRVGLPGVVAAAMEMDQPNVLWETTLAVPPVGEPLVDERAGRVEVVTALGSVIDVPVDRIKGSLVFDEAVVSLDVAEARQVVRDALRLPGGLLALSAGPGGEAVAVFDPKVTPKRFRNVILPNPMAAAPAALAEGLLVPCRAGQVLLIHPRTGGQIAEPFQPELAPAQQVDWRSPAVIDPESAVVSDGQTRLYRLGVKDQPKPHLVALDQAEMPGSIASELAVVGEVVYAVDASGNLRHFTLPKLAEGEAVTLGGLPVWGPRRVGSLGFLATEDEQLLCLDGQGKVVWKVALPHGPLAGTPLVVGDEVICTSVTGVLWRAEAATGKEVARRETGIPLAAGPVPLGDRFLLTGADGALYLVK